MVLFLFIFRIYGPKCICCLSCSGPSVGIIVATGGVAVVPTDVADAADAAADAALVPLGLAVCGIWWTIPFPYPSWDTDGPKAVTKAKLVGFGLLGLLVKLPKMANVNRGCCKNTKSYKHQQHDSLHRSYSFAPPYCRLFSCQSAMWLITFESQVISVITKALHMSQDSSNMQHQQQHATATGRTEEEANGKNTKGKKQMRGLGGGSERKKQHSLPGQWFELQGSPGTL